MAEPSSVAVVTGGASGIGLSIVRHLAGEGMGVIAVDRDGDACARARVELAEATGRVRVVEGDIGTPEGAALAIDSAVEAFVIPADEERIIANHTRDLFQKSSSSTA